MLRRLRIENLVLIREAELTFGTGLNAVTGETGAGKTIFAQAIGLLLGSRADASAVGSDGAEAYVEAELDVPEGFFDEDDLASLAELRPEGEAGLVIARRVFADGRTRAYAWGRAVAREDVGRGLRDVRQAARGLLTACCEARKEYAVTCDVRRGRLAVAVDRRERPCRCPQPCPGVRREEHHQQER